MCSYCLTCLFSPSWISSGCICSVVPKPDLEPKQPEIPANLAIKTPVPLVQKGTPEVICNGCEMCQFSVSAEILILLKLIFMTLQKVMLKYLSCVPFLFPRGLWKETQTLICVSRVHGHGVGEQVLGEWADSILIFLNSLLGFESIPWVSLNWRLSRGNTVLSSQRPLHYCLQSAFNRCCEGRNESGSSAVRILFLEIGSKV